MTFATSRTFLCFAVLFCATVVNSQRTGAPRQRDVNDPEIREYARRGVRKLSDSRQGPNDLILVEVLNATSQVVSGMRHIITVRLGASDCPKRIRSSCRLLSDSRIETCVVDVWSQPWIDRGNPRIDVTCNN